MAGLLSGMGNKLSGLLGDPALQNAFWLTVASGSDQNRAAQLKEERRLSDQEARLEEYRQLQMEQARMEMQRAQEAQQRQQYTQALLAAGSSQNPGLLQDPTFQAQLRQKAAAYGDPAALEQGGLLSPLPQSQKMPMSYIEHQLSQGDKGYAEFLRQRQAATGGQGQYFSGVTVKMPDGSYAVVQPGNRPGMGPNTVPLPGAPLTYDPAVAAAISAAQASGKVTGEASGTREKNAPDFAITMRELENVSTDGGLIDQSTGSGLGAKRDQAAGFFGIATEGAQAIAQLAPLADRVLKTVPRFEGPQSDKDTQSYREAAGQLNDPTKPPEIRKAAAREILRLMRERQGQFMTTEDAGWGIVN